MTNREMYLKGLYRYLSKKITDYHEANGEHDFVNQFIISPLGSAYGSPESDIANDAIMEHTFFSETIDAESVGAQFIDIFLDEDFNINYSFELNVKDSSLSQATPISFIFTKSSNQIVIFPSELDRFNSISEETWEHMLYSVGE